MPDALIRRCRPLLGTYVEVAVPPGHEAVLADAFAAIAHVHARMSFHEETSDLARLRRAPAGEAVAVDPDTAEVLRLAQWLHGRSGGLFDITIGAELVRDGLLPPPPGVDPEAMRGTAADLVVGDDGRVVCRAPMLIDLGGIAKGYAVDRAVDCLIERGVPRAMVNAGGDLRVLGDTPETILLREADGSVRLSIALADAALASSSAAIRSRDTGARVTSPHRGRNREAVVAAEAVSIVAPRCAIADAMTKIAIADRALAAAILCELGGAIVERPPLTLAA